jgi:hypothetical protein
MQATTFGGWCGHPGPVTSRGKPRQQPIAAAQRHPSQEAFGGARSQLIRNRNLRKPSPKPRSMHKYSGRNENQPTSVECLEFLP